MPKTPAPGSYEAESVFEKSRKSGKGFGFGSGRSEMKATAFIKKNENPGPGAYEYSSTRSNIQPSMKGKGKIDNREQICVPGPGTCTSMLMKMKICPVSAKQGSSFLPASSPNQPADSPKMKSSKSITTWCPALAPTNRQRPSSLLKEGITCRVSKAPKAPNLGSLSNSTPKIDARVHNCSYSAPGPGTYRLPS